MAIDLNNLNTTDITASEDILADIFEDSGVNSNVGTVVRELIIRPMAVLRAATQTAQNDFFNKLDLYAVADGAAADTATIDAVASTYRLRRLSGKASSGTVIIELDQDIKTFISKDIYFSTGSVNLYLDKTYIVIDSTDTYPYESTAEVEYIKPLHFQDTLYIVLPVSTEAGIVDTIPTGTQVTYVGTLENIVSTKVLSPISGGAAEETNQELANRVLYGAVKGYLSTPIQIKAAFAEDFNIPPQNVAAFGMADTIVSRSVNPITGISQGGYIDVYVNASKSIATGITSGIARRLPSASNKFYYMLPEDVAAGLYNITNISLDDTSLTITNVTTDFDVIDSWHKLDALSARFTAFQSVLVTFEVNAPSSINELAVNLEYTYMRDIKALQDYVDSPDRRALGLDTVIKGAIPCFIDMSLDLIAKDTSFDKDAITQAILSKIHNLPIGKQEITASDIADALKDFPVTIKFPIVITGTLELPDTKIVTTTNTASYKLPIQESTTYDSKAVSFFSDVTRISLNIGL